MTAVEEDGPEPFFWRLAGGSPPLLPVLFFDSVWPMFANFIGRTHTIVYVKKSRHPRVARGRGHSKKHSSICRRIVKMGHF